MTTSHLTNASVELSNGLADIQSTSVSEIERKSFKNSLRHS
jgi:hypothetical protein